MDIAIRPLTADESMAAIRADARAAADVGALADACPYRDGTAERDAWLDAYYHRVRWLSGEMSV